MKQQGMTTPEYVIVFIIVAMVVFGIFSYLGTSQWFQ